MNAAIAHFAIATLVSSCGILFVLLAKAGLRKHISARWQYRLDLLFFVLLTIPLIPRRFFLSLNLPTWFNISQFEDITVPNIITTEEVGPAYGMGLLQDFAVSVERPEYFSTVFIGIWVVGVIGLVVAMLRNNRSLRLIKESAKPIEDKQMLSIFTYCKTEVGVKCNLLFRSSILVKTPMAMGFFKTLIILPTGKMSLSDIRYAVLHELMHCKNMDIKINVIMSLFQVLYWFNPLVYLIFKQMRFDRELACDASVLEMLPGESHVAYGETLLNFAKGQSSMFPLATWLCDSEPQIVKRIKHIASFTTDSVFSKVKSICIFILMGAIVLFQIPVLSALADNDNRFHFQAGNVQYVDLSYFFGDFEGSFVLYDLDADIYIIHNRDMSVTRVSPNSTYKIFSTLIALETGVLDAADTLRKWDGTMQPFDAWNQNHNLATAMQYSVNWYFQNIDAQVGIGELYFYLSQLSYGNTNLSGGTDFWIESSLRISPLEQVKLLLYFYQNNTVFADEHISTLKDVLRLSERNGAVLSGKTGTGIINSRIANGWFIGYVENNGRDFIFATYIQGQDSAGGSVASGITLSILEYKGIF